MIKYIKKLYKDGYLSWRNPFSLLFYLIIVSLGLFGLNSEFDHYVLFNYLKYCIWLFTTIWLLVWTVGGIVFFYNKIKGNDKF